MDQRESYKSSVGEIAGVRIRTCVQIGTQLDDGVGAGDDAGEHVSSAFGAIACARVSFECGRKSRGGFGLTMAGHIEYNRHQLVVLEPVSYVYTLSGTLWAELPQERERKTRKQPTS